MRKLLVISLALVYLAVSSGIIVNSHYCMGKLESWSLALTENTQCGNCGMEKKAAENTGCCKDEFKHLKLELDQKSNKAVVYNFNVVESESIIPFISYPDNLNKQQIFTPNLINNPLRCGCIATFIRNRNLRI